MYNLQQVCKLGVIQITKIERILQIKPYKKQRRGASVSITVHWPSTAIAKRLSIIYRDPPLESLLLVTSYSAYICVSSCRHSGSDLLLGGDPLNILCMADSYC